MVMVMVIIGNLEGGEMVVVALLDELCETHCGLWGWVIVVTMGFDVKNSQDLGAFV